jgi:hypothetical protein
MFVAHVVTAEHGGPSGGTTTRPAIASSPSSVNTT